MRKFLVFCLFYLLFYAVTSASSYLRLMEMDRPLLLQFAGVWREWIVNCVIYFPHAYFLYMALRMHNIKKSFILFIPIAIVLAYLIRYIFAALFLQQHLLIGDYLPDNYALTIALSSFGVLYFFISYTHQNRIKWEALTSRNAAMRSAELKNKVDPTHLFQQMHDIEIQIEENQLQALIKIEELCQQLREIVYDNVQSHK